MPATINAVAANNLLNIRLLVLLSKEMKTTPLKDTQKFPNRFGGFQRDPEIEYVIQSYISSLRLLPLMKFRSKMWPVKFGLSFFNMERNLFILRMIILAKNRFSTALQKLKS
jgi:hypothetical protein